MLPDLGLVPALGVLAVDLAVPEALADPELAVLVVDPDLGVVLEVPVVLADPE